MFLFFIRLFFEFFYEIILGNYFLSINLLPKCQNLVLSLPKFCVVFWSISDFGMNYLIHRCIGCIYRCYIGVTEAQYHFFLMCWIDDVVFYRNPLKLVTVFSFLGGEMLTWKLEQDRTKLAEGDLQGDIENFRYFPLETKNMDLDFLWTTCVLLNHCLW